ncbi:MAG TPA: glutathione synthase [Myxococcaceae bacterium]|nr:glutathione synthase [Myxococcaceae bacterium]
MRFGFLMDPLTTIQVGHDTTFAFMQEAFRRGHEVLAIEQRDLSFQRDQAYGRTRRVTVHEGDTARPFSSEPPASRPLGELDVLFLRKDPPVDVDFLHATQLVELAGERLPFFINEPSGLRTANEKLSALLFPDLVPPTVVTADAGELRAFVDSVGGEAVFKPVDGFAGRGILFASKKDRNFNSILELSTLRGTQAVMAQAYLPESREGDKRILLLDGKPLGAVLRVPSEHDLRGNIAAGGKAVKTVITPRDREICERLAPTLKRLGLHFVGIDVIGRYLTEVNVTSPTMAVEIDALDGVNIERDVIDFAEKQAVGRTRS